MGAVYQAAALSKAFKVKPFLVRDAAVFPIQVGARHPAKDRVNQVTLHTACAVCCEFAGGLHARDGGGGGDEERETQQAYPL